MKEYCLALVFDPSATHILLQHRTYPEWQRGLWNGFGGHVEPGETALEAMIRETKEETNLYDFNTQIQWRQFATVTDGDLFVMSCFTARLPGLRALARHRFGEEFCRVYSVHTALAISTIGNIPTLITLARDRYFHPVTLVETNRRDPVLKTV